MDLGNLTIQELLQMAQKYEEKKQKHNKNMKTYREKHLEQVKPKCALLAKKLYWRKKGFEINDLGEKIPIINLTIN
jgi:hypothetical protein